MNDINNKIQEQIKQHKVVLYMKGTPQFPMCGFSAKVVKILSLCKITDYFSVNVLEDESIRQGIKEFSHWPTIPQLYINGEFIGGCDIVTELYQSNQLQELLEKV